METNTKQRLYIIDDKYWMGTGQYDRNVPPNEYIVEVPKKESAKLRAKDLRLRKSYGITLEDWQKKFNDQEGVCAICKTLPKNGILCTDHEHIKGYKKMSAAQKQMYIRGLCCFQCNTAFGRIERRKNPRELLKNIVNYFDRYYMKGDVRA